MDVPKGRHAPGGRWRSQPPFVARVLGTLLFWAPFCIATPQPIADS
jgi:hypothetical protein